jgi:AraC-like DNA-binding protein
MLHTGSPDARREFFAERGDPLLSIAWNRGPTQTVWIDEVPMAFPSGNLLALVVSQSFRFAIPTDVVLWQFNRAFYCIVDHDQEVSCAGLLFYGSHGPLVLDPGEEGRQRLHMLLAVFEDEFRTRDDIQGEMLRVLLKRLIIICTRLTREHLSLANVPDVQLDVLRRFNLLVEQHYKVKHRVSDYASLLNKSPKTLANLSTRFQQKSPLAVIRARIALEARRLLLYTDRSAKQVASELGFEDPATFSRFFRSEVGASAVEFRSMHRR